MNYFNSHVWSSQQTCRKWEKEGNANSLWRPLTLKTRQASPSLGLWDPGQWSVPQHHWKPFREGCQLPAGIKNICGGLPEDGQLISSLTCSKCFLWLKPALQSLLHGIHGLDPYGYSFLVSFVTVLLVYTKRIKTIVSQITIVHLEGQSSCPHPLHWGGFLIKLQNAFLFVLLPGKSPLPIA